MDAFCARPGMNRTPPLADSASVPAIGRHPSPLSTCAVIVTVLAVPALHTPASCQLAPPAFFTEDPSSTGVTPNFIRRVSRLGNIRERPCVRTRTLSHRRHGGTCLFPSALDLQHERALRPTATVGRRSTAPETVYHRPLAQSGANVPPWRPAMVVPTTSDPHRSHDMALAANQALMRVTDFTAIAIMGEDFRAPETLVGSGSRAPATMLVPQNDSASCAYRSLLGFGRGGGTCHSRSAGPQGAQNGAEENSLVHGTIPRTAEDRYFDHPSAHGLHAIVFLRGHARQHAATIITATRPHARPISLQSPAPVCDHICRSHARQHATTSVAATRASTRPLPSQPRAPARDHICRSHALQHATTSVAATRSSTRPLSSQPRAPARDHFRRNHAHQHATTFVAATRTSTRPLPLQPRAPARDYICHSHALQHATTSVAATRSSTRPHLSQPRAPALLCNNTGKSLALRLPRR